MGNPRMNPYYNRAKHDNACLRRIPWILVTEITIVVSSHFQIGSQNTVQITLCKLN